VLSEDDPMRICAIVPVKRLSESKTRLASSLSLVERQDLTLRMLRHILGIVVKLFDEVVIVGLDEEVKKVSRDYSASFMLDKSTSLNQALNQAINRCTQKNFEAVFIVAADLPILSGKEVKRFLASTSDESVVIFPSKDCGTNALFLRPPKAIPARFGPNSLARHLREAMARNRKFKLYWSPGFSFDIDSPRDLQTFESFKE